jgi:hypothetical protein
MITITLVYSPAARQVQEWTQTVPDTTTAGEALDRLLALLTVDTPEAAPREPGPTDSKDALTVAVWGRKVSPHHVLREGDRVEVLRPLRVDPKLARRERFQQQGARNAGLFARRRPGSKAGY